MTSKPRLLLALGVAVVTALAFLPSLDGEFLNWDDDANFLLNPDYRGLRWENLRWMFGNTFGHYMPITWLTLGADYELWGMNPRGYHATSLLLHAINGALLFLLLRALLVRGRPGLSEIAALPIAASGALFYAIHPQRVESVAWITERRDVTAGLFFFLSLLAYVAMVGRPSGTSSRRRWLALSAVAFAASLLCKSMAMTLPVALLLIDAAPLRRFETERPSAVLMEKIPFFALMLGAVVLTSITQTQAEAIFSVKDYPLTQSLAQPGYRISFYALKTIWPANLSPLYFYRPEIGLPQALGWIAVLGATSLAVLRRRAFPAAAVAWGAFLVLLAPVSGLVQAGPHFAADRYSYFAAVPFAGLAAAVLAAIPEARRPLGLAAGAAVVAGLGLLTWRQCGVWKDSIALWNHAIELDPDVYLSRYHRARAYASRGQWDRAVEDYGRAIALQGGGWHEPWAGRARARLARGDAAGAAEDAARALLLKPGWGDALVARGMAFAALGRSREALADFSRALQDRPRFVEARVQRATERAKNGDLDGAMEDMNAAVSFDPQPAVLLRRATLRGLKGDFEGVIADCSEAIRLNPGYADAYVRRGLARMERGDAVGGSGDFARALELAPPGWPPRRQVEEFLRRSRESK